MHPNTTVPSKPAPFSVQLFPWIYISSLKPPLNIETEIGNRYGGGVQSSPVDHHHLVDCCGGGGEDEKFRPINCNRNKLQKRLLRSRFSLCVFGWNFARSELILAPVELRCVGGTLRGRLGHTHPQPVNYGKARARVERGVGGVLATKPFRCWNSGHSTSSQSRTAKLKWILPELGFFSLCLLRDSSRLLVVAGKYP